MNKDQKKIDLIVEARRQLENAETLYGSMVRRRDQHLPFQRVEKLYANMLNSADGAASVLLTIGQAYWVLDKDVSAARSAFFRMQDWAPTIREALQGMSTERLAGEEAPHWRSLLGSVLCLILSGNSDALNEFIGTIPEGVFLPPGKMPKKMMQFSAFTSNLFSLLSGRPESHMDLINHFDSHDSATSGYGELLSAIFSSDENGFNHALGVCAESFSRRVKYKENALHEYGYGKVSQVATFDALGTSLCRIASSKGMGIFPSADMLYPPEFWKAA